MNSGNGLPPGQSESVEFPRFGLGRFARRFPSNLATVALEVRGDVERPIGLGEELAQLPRVEQVSDFHCVTTWSRRAVPWSGFRFSDFYRDIVVPKTGAPPEARLVVFHGQDGYRCCLPIDDLLAADVLLADRLDGQALGLEHGAPLRLVAAAHYGYKNVKHLSAIEFWRDRRNYRFPRPYPGLLDHPRARVAFEERGVGLPGWVFRYLYRPLVGPTIRNFRKAVAEYRARGRSRSE
jgi:DMSO/TMAO reductase YedYZ molybdopterin-dependent catalytic subunit